MPGRGSSTIRGTELAPQGTCSEPSNRSGLGVRKEAWEEGRWAGHHPCHSGGCLNGKTQLCPLPPPQSPVALGRLLPSSACQSLPLSEVEWGDF